MDRYAEPAASHQVDRQDKAAPENDDDAFLSLIVQNINTLITTAEIERHTKLQLVSYYVTAKYNNFVQTGQVKAIEEAIQKQRWALNIIDQKDTNYGVDLDHLGVLLEVKYDRFGMVADLQEAVEKAEEAVRVTPPNHPDLATMLNNLGTKLESRYERTGNMADLETAIEKTEEAVRVTPPNHPNLAIMLNNLGTKLKSRYERTGNMADLEIAIEKTEEAVRVTPLNYPNLAIMLNNLGNKLQSRYERIGNMADLETAIEKVEEAVRVTPPNYLDLAAWLNNLGNKLESRYERTGNIADLETAIEKAEEAVRVTPPNHPDLATWLNNLGNKLQNRYKRIGNIADMETAIEKVEEAVRVTPPNHPDLAAWLNNLGNKLQSRYERIGNMADLETAIKKAEKAVRVTLPNHSDLAGRLNNLGNKLESRYKRTGNIADLETAIEKTEEAVRVTPPNHPNLATMLNNLGNKLKSRYEHTGNMADLETAIEKTEEAVRVTPPNHPDLAAWLNNLGNKLQSRYERTGNMADLETAIEKAEEAVRVTPPNHPDLAGRLNNLGRKQLLHPDPLLTANALMSLFRSWHCDVGIPSHRLRSALAATDILISQKRWNEAADLSVEAINLLPLMNRRTLSRDDQQHTLTIFTGLAAKACSLSLQCGRPVERSVEILEQGRGAILGLLIDDRRDVSPLYQSCPEQAAEYERLRTEVNTDPNDYNAGEVGEQMRKRRMKAVQELEDCIERIRRLPGHERFLLSASTKELQQQAAAGPIVVVNVTDIRSDAIIITPDHIKLLPLPAFSAEVLRSWKRQRLTEFGRSDFGKKNKKYRAFLSWLWDACVQPIVALLCPRDKTYGAAKPLLRAWWIGTGEASAVPFHAAGDHSPGSGDNTISHMVCSYTPTIKALEFSRQRLGQCRRLVAVRVVVEGAPSLCVATMPRTPGMAPLPGVVDELSRINAVAASTFFVAHLPTPSAADVKAQLTTCHVFHFAGHGMANTIDPSRGSLVLQTSGRPDAEPKPDLLSVNDIARLYLPHAQLAYLSACSTAENEATQLADEVIHLVSGFQVAGFPHVVGSMWQSADKICADMAHLFYQRICAADQGVLTDGSVAGALRRATLEVRQRWWEEPLLWTQYVHFGG